VSHAKKKIIIVESPTKSRTIKSFLGKTYTVVSSQGHIKDLPKSKLGVDVEHDFQPSYIKIRGKASIIKAIKKACKNSSVVFIAPDPDREGEAIAQHLAEELDSTATQVKRALFYEITPEHVKHALENPTCINQNLVNAHKARRVLDRIVGYYTSPLLWTIIKRGLSAGRVQSVSLRLVCEREKEIIAFKPIPYWTADAEFRTEKNELFKAALWKIDGKIRKIETKKELERIQNECKPGTFLPVTQYRVTNPVRTPPPPFITSTLQQEASKRYRFPPRKTMAVAQSLYEGVPLPEGSIGIITYMRTDSVRANQSALENVRTFIAAKYGEEFLNPSIRVYKDKKNTQGGHEAIRPTKAELEPQSIKDHLTPDQYKIYSLIFNRFVASQMSDAKYLQTDAVISLAGVDFKAEELKPVFLGYQKVSGDVVKRGFVPKMKIGDKVELCDIDFQEKETDPPPRYTEASLIKKLEENGIGRPSTYAYIVQTLFDRGYTIRETGKIKATELGIQVYDIIIPRFSKIFEVSFTAKMERELDQIEIGKKTWTEVVREFYEPFVVTLNKTKEEAHKIKEAITEQVDKRCPKCQRPLIKRWGRYGKFLACSGFPDCKYSENLDVETSDKTCPECGKPLIIKHGKFGKFLACSGYPDCKYTENLGHDVPCPLCRGDVIIISTRRGKIYKCKQCDFSSFYPPIDETCSKCGKGLLLKRKKKVCPVCDNIIKPKKNENNE
jgi:DNA topoisomerase-1